MSETKVEFAERRKRSLKNVLYRYMKDYGCKNIDNFFQFVTSLNSRGKCLVDLIPKKVKNSHFLFPLYTKPPRKYRKPKFKIGDRTRISK